jgi:hypothetical protein
MAVNGRSGRGNGTMEWRDFWERGSQGFTVGVSSGVYFSQVLGFQV